MHIEQNGTEDTQVNGYKLFQYIISNIVVMKKYMYWLLQLVDTIVQK